MVTAQSPKRDFRNGPEPSFHQSGGKARGDGGGVNKVSGHCR